MGTWATIRRRPGAFRGLPWGWPPGSPTLPSTPRAEPSEPGLAQCSPGPELWLGLCHLDHGPPSPSCPRRRPRPLQSWRGGSGLWCRSEGTLTDSQVCERPRAPWWLSRPAAASSATGGTHAHWHIHGQIPVLTRMLPAGSHRAMRAPIALH